MNAAIFISAKSAPTFAQWKNGLVQIWGIDESHGYCRVVLLSQRKAEAYSLNNADWSSAAANSRMALENPASH